MGNTYSANSWLSRPLCRRYIAAVFSSTDQLRLIANADGPQVICWALGSLINGESEVLGAWLSKDGTFSPRSSVFGELKARGAEFIRLGVGNLAGEDASFKLAYCHGEIVDSVEQALEAVAARVPPRHRQEMLRCFRAAAEAETLELGRSELARFQGSGLGEKYPDVVQLWGDALARFEPIFSLNEQLRGLVRLADRTAADVRGRLNRAILQHGPFSDSGAALDFVALSLARAEQRLDRERGNAEAARGVGRRASGAGLSMSDAVGVPTLA
ncbi:transposase [Pelomonas parva]|uniref:Transposase n=1 Tax=Pelomonas parva TaxID=3299032 RepID=A0ABW7F8C0_9BURK